jgi:hypothetical protein
MVLFLLVKGCTTPEEDFRILGDTCGRSFFVTIKLSTKERPRCLFLKDNSLVKEIAREIAAVDKPTLKIYMIELVMIMRTSMMMIFNIHGSG